MNLAALDVAAEILGTRRLLVAPGVLGEALYIFTDDTRATRTPVDAALLAARGINWIPVMLSTQEQSCFIRNARVVDDGEAQALAVAEIRKITLLSDDRAAARLAASLNVPVETTLDLLAAWSGGQPDERVAGVLKLFQVRAQYAPPRGHPLRRWFLDRV